jgi:uncharacterized protein
MTLDLQPAHRQMLRAILAAHAPDAEAWAYGSRVDGGAHGGSDLDLVLRNPEHPEVPRKNLSRLRGAFSESHLPFQVDVSDWARLSEADRRKIESRHVVVWSPEPAAASASLQAYPNALQ